MDLQEHQFIALFDSEQAMELAKQAQVETFADHAIIFEEGEVPDFLYLVLEGEVQFLKAIDPSHSHYQLVGQAKPNDFFGEFGILDGQPRSAQAVVGKGAKLAKIPRSVLIEILNNTRGSVVLQLFHFIIQRLRVTTEEYVKQIAHKEKMVLLGEMVNTIIHDFKSPLSSIHLSGSVLREMYSSDEDTCEWCDLIQAQATRMTAMAEELLDFAGGGARILCQPLHLATALRKFKKLNQVYLDQAQVKLTIDCPENIIFPADENKLMRVFQNLVNNAVEAFQHRGGTIAIAAALNQELVRVTIADNGPGIPDTIQADFFEPFVTYGKKGGTGLGTAIAKSIIDAHRGTIHFTTQAGIGTIFYIDLPLTGGQQQQLEQML